MKGIALQVPIIGLISLVIIILILSALGPTIIDNTDTRACDNTIGDNVTGCALENSSGSSKTMYSLVELLYPIIGVIIVVIAGFGLSRKFD